MFYAWTKWNLVWYQKHSIFLEKQRRVEVCETMLSEYQDKMECIKTGDETWIYAYDPETTDQSSEYRAESRPREKIAPESFKNQDHVNMFSSIIVM